MYKYIRWLTYDKTIPNWRKCGQHYSMFIITRTTVIYLTRANAILYFFCQYCIFTGYVVVFIPCEFLVQQANVLDKVERTCWKQPRFFIANNLCLYNVTQLINIYRATSLSLQWHNNERCGVSNHQPYDYLLNRLFRRRSKKTSKLRVIGLCEGNSPVTGEILTQRASNAENVWYFHLMTSSCVLTFGGGKGSRGKMA